MMLNAIKYLAGLAALAAVNGCDFHKLPAAPPTAKVEFYFVEESPREGLTKVVNSDNGQTLYSHPKVLITGERIAHAYKTKDDYGDWLVVIDFTKEGKKEFADITGSNIGKQLGIFIEGNLINAPVIRDRISGGRAIISGGITKEKADSLVDLMYGKSKGDSQEGVDRVQSPKQ